ncbi:hypothetical protein [Hymenobacter negativus]|uniref:Lipoprotein n=1 Tax=Hymenobacter negativus TaxID=2795026 RepID=A0ABS3QK95_9BACT|nr:hypothetical protein [Hymenobacter negativus]MBO2011657.1 hypothetical protein [Hymenobacter negativus]
MKQPLCGFVMAMALALSITACQPQTDATAAKAAPALVTKPSVTVQPASASSALLPQVDLSYAWSNATAEAKGNPTMEGFYGPDHYRISFYFSKVHRDSLHPEQYHIWGINRYKKVITPFEGTCTVTRIAALPDTAEMENSSKLRAYTAFAEFTLREDPKTKGAGVYSGKAMLDFCVNARNQARQATFNGIDLGFDNPTKGSGLLFQGVWRNNATGQQKPASWSSNFLVIVPQALEKIGLGSRGDTVYPELAKYGWNEWYENDEWWATSSKPNLSL